jgi:hypothetical protein
METEGNVFLAMAVVLLTSLLSGTVLMVKNRRNPLISSRGFWSVLMELYGIIGFVLTWTIKAILYGEKTDAPNCAVINTIGFWFLMLGCHFVVERCLMLIIKFNITLDTIKFVHNQFLLESKKDGMYYWLEKRQYFSDSPVSLARLFCLFVSVLWTVPVLFFVRNSCFEGQVNIRILMFLVLFVLLCSVIICRERLKRVEENFGIKKEMKLLALTVTGSLVLTALALAITRGSMANLVIMYLVIGFSVEWISMWNILRLIHFGEFKRPQGLHSKIQSNSKVEEESKQPPASITSQSLIDNMLETLNDELKTGAFEKFLQQEFAVEGLLFWKSVQVFKRKFDSGGSEISTKAAQQMFQEFIADDARLMLNLSASCRRKLIQIFTTDEGLLGISQSTFDQAEREVIFLLANDPFRRFLLDSKVNSNQVPSTITSV